MVNEMVAPGVHALWDCTQSSGDTLKDGSASSAAARIGAKEAIANVSTTSIELIPIGLLMTPPSFQRSCFPMRAYTGALGPNTKKPDLM
jgi:hypothetical protein